MGLGRSFNGAVARVLKIHAEKANDPAPDRATFYRWRKEDKEFGELVKATMEDEYGFAEEKEHVLIDGGYPESEEVEREWHITKDGKKGPLKKEKVKKTWAPPNQQAVIKGMDRRSRHIRRWEKNDGEVDKVPGPVAGMLEDENGNEIPAPVARVEVMVKMVEGKPQVQVEIPKEGKDG